MKATERTVSKNIDLALDQVNIYKPITEINYKEIYGKLILYSIYPYIFSSSVLVTLFFLVTAPVLYSFDVLTNTQLVVWILTIFIMDFLAVCYIKHSEKIINKTLKFNNLNKLIEHNYFYEITTEQYQEVKELSGIYPILKEKIKEILILRNDIITFFDYEQLMIYNLQFQHNISKSTEKDRKEKLKIIKSLSE